jgi:hypothetical protein
MFLYLYVLLGWIEQTPSYELVHTVLTVYTNQFFFRILSMHQENSLQITSLLALAGLLQGITEANAAVLALHFTIHAHNGFGPFICTTTLLSGSLATNLATSFAGTATSTTSLYHLFLSGLSKKSHIS